MYIYGLCDPRNEQLRYIGVTKYPNKRFAAHLCDKNPCHRTSWLQSLKREDLKPEMFIIDEVADENWQREEKFWINYWKYIGADLTNSTDGGDGLQSPTPETRAKISAAQTGEKHHNWGKHHSAETLAKMSAANTGKSPTPETRAKLSAAARNISDETRVRMSASRAGDKNPNWGKSPSDETRAKLSVAHIGKHPSDETRTKISAGNRGKYISPETRAKMSAAHIGKHPSTETREKIREANIGKHSRPRVLCQT